MFERSPVGRRPPWRAGRLLLVRRALKLLLCHRTFWSAESLPGGLVVRDLSGSFWLAGSCVRGCSGWLKSFSDGWSAPSGRPGVASEDVLVGRRPPRRAGQPELVREPLVNWELRKRILWSPRGLPGGLVRPSWSA